MDARSRNPHLNGLLFIVARLPSANNGAIHHLIHIAARNPHILHTSLVVPRLNHRLLNNRLLNDNGLLNDHRLLNDGGRNHRLRGHYNRIRVRGVIYGGGKKPCAKNARAYCKPRAAMMMVMVTRAGTTEWRRPSK